MKLLDGDSLAKRIRTVGPMPISRAATIARQIAAALSAAHKTGIVHRDLKPDNIILVPDEEVMIGERATVLDFGIAKLLSDKPLSQKTRTGMMMGTPVYMSPEQCRGAGEVDLRTDVYALGCMVFEMLVGHPPFVGEGAGEILGMHQFVEPPDIRTLRADVPPDLMAVVMRSLAKKPDQRQQNMAEFAAALQPFAAGMPSAERSAQLPAVSSGHLMAFTPPIVQAATPPQPLPSTMSSARGEVVAPTPKRKSVLPFVLGGAVLAAVAIVIAVAASSSSEKPQVAATPADASQAATVPAAPLGQPDAVLERVDVPALLAEANSLMAARNWEDAIAVAAKVSLHEPSNADAKAIGARAYAESKHELADRELTAAIARGDAHAVKAAFSKVGNDSVYKADAKQRHDKFVASFVANAKRQATALAARRKCAELEKLAASVAAYPAAVKVVEDVDCSAAVVTAREEPVASTGDKSSSTSNKAVAELVDEANKAAMAGQYAKALATAEQALRMEAGNQRALTAAAISACNLQDAAKAKKYIAQMSGQRQGMLRQVCLRNKVSID